MKRIDPPKLSGDSRFLGMLVNPKTGEPMFAAMIREEILIYPGSDISTIEGEAYLDTDGPNTKYSTCEFGYERVHCPQGVITRGVGNGTCLYAAAGLTAHMAKIGEIDYPLQADSEDIASFEETRSVAADAWWEQALRKGLTYQEYVEKEDPDAEPEVERENFDETIESRRYTRSLFGEVANYLAEDNGWDDVEVDRISVEGSYATTTEPTPKSTTLDVFPWEPRKKACGTKHFCAFWSAQSQMLELPSGQEDFWFNEDQMKAVSLRGCSSNVIEYFRDVSRLATGGSKLFETVLFATALDVKYAEAAEKMDLLEEVPGFGGVVVPEYPFVQENPRAPKRRTKSRRAAPKRRGASKDLAALNAAFLASLDKRERKALESRADLYKRLRFDVYGQVDE